MTMQSKPWIFFRVALAAAVLFSLLANAMPVQAYLDSVGSMWPTGGSTGTITVGGSYTIYVQVYKAGVTPGGGQGANITCTLHWAPVPYFGGGWGSVTQTAMSYNSGYSGYDNDEYMATISPAVGLYEFTAYCTDTTDSTQSWQGAANGRLVVDTASGECNAAVQSDNNISTNGLGHDSFSTVYRSPLGAVKTNQGTVDLWFRTCMDDVDQLPKIRVYDDRTNTDYGYVTMSFDRHEADTTLGGVTLWKKTVSIPTSPSLLYYIFQALGGSAVQYYQDDPKFYGGGWGQSEIDLDTAQKNSYQITVYDQNFTTPDWMKNAVVYQIFPERFRDGDPSNNPADDSGWIYGSKVIARTWSEGVCDPRGAECPGAYGNQFFGGDLQGVIDELDTLQDLGVTTIYLNPIFRSPSNHKYDTQDYMVIDPAFGSNALFQTLASQAEARGIKIILDGVFNHVSSDSKYFDRYSRFDASGNVTSPDVPGTNDQSGACESTASSWRSWFTFSAGTGKCYDGTPGSLTQTYTDWAGYDSLPKLDSSLAAVRTYIYNAVGSVARYWLSLGADGWRFDVGGDVDGGSAANNSDGYWNGYRTAARAQSSDALLLGEEWGDASSWLAGDQWDSVMNYRFQSALLNWMFDSCTGDGCSGGVFSENDFNGSSASGTIQATNVDEFDLRLKSIQEDYPPAAWQTMMNLLDSHDTSRVLFMLKKISGDNADTAKTKLKFITLFMFTYPGAPTIYYGDEVGLAPDDVWVDGHWVDGNWVEGKWEDDPYNRAPYPWADLGLSPDTTLQAQFRKMAVLRGQYSVLRTGDLTDSTRHNTNRTYAYARTNGTSDLAVVLLNRSTTTAQAVTMSNLNSAFNGTVLYDVLNCTGSPVTCPAYTVSGGSVTVSGIPALWGAVLVKGPLPAFSVSLASDDYDLALNGTATITATVTDIGGQPAASGTTVNFTLVGGGTLDGANPATVGSNGQASVTYTAPSSGETVAVIRATSGTYASAAGTASIFAGYPATISGQVSRKLTIGRAELESTIAGAKAIKTGLGEPVVSLAKFSGNPHTTGSGTVKTNFVDINVVNAGSSDEIEFRLNCTGCSGSEVLWWWNPSSSKWEKWATGLTGYNASDGYIWGKANSGSTPSLSALTGTSVMGGAEGPNRVALETFRADGAPSVPWGWLVLAALGLSAAVFWLIWRR